MPGGVGPTELGDGQSIETPTAPQPRHLPLLLRTDATWAQRPASLNRRLSTVDRFRGGRKKQLAQRHTHSVTRVGVSPCSPMAEGHGDSAPQGALKVALSGTLDRASVLVGRSVAWFRFTRNCTWAEGESNSALSPRYPTTKSYLPSGRAFCPLGDAALSFTTVL